METLHTDMGRQFESDMVKHLWAAGCEENSDGMVERFNRTLIDQLAKTLLSVRENGTLSCCRLLLHTTLVYPPAPGSGPLGRGRPVDGSLEDFASSLLRHLDTALSQTKENNIVASRRQYHFYDARLRHEPYEVGDLVWLNDPTESRRKRLPTGRDLTWFNGEWTGMVRLGSPIRLVAHLESSPSPDRPL